MTTTPAPPLDPAPRPVVAMVLYQGMTLLDLIGPHTAFAASMELHLVASTMDDVVCDTGVRVRPETTFADAPGDVDVLFVPGGPGTAGAMGDARLLDFLTDRGARARYVTAVCTGSIVLGAAGLLEGYRATTHWTHLDLLPLLGAQPVAERVVSDRNRITGGGVTAGIDFGLTLLEQMQGRRAAEVAQLSMEYDPHPPLDSGSPRTADPAVVAMVESFTAPGRDAVRAAWQQVSR